MLKNLCQKMFGRSLWVYHANSGGCNGCDIEVLNVLTPYYDVERFGIKLVGSPRHAGAQAGIRYRLLRVRRRHLV